MNSNKPLSIVIATDSHYAIMAGALIRSIETTIRPNQKLDFYIVDDNINLDNKQKLKQSSNPKISTLYFRTLNQIVGKNTRLPVDPTSYPVSIYMKLFIPMIVPDYVDRVLFMDVDMIVEKDITPLYYTDLGSNIIAAVGDPRVTRFDNEWGGIKNYQKLGIPGNTPYFNSGLMIIDVDKWRSKNIGMKSLETIIKFRQYANYPDQYGLNIILANHWLPLDERWNYFSCYNEKEPYIIHFTGRKPIYKSYDNYPEYLELFNYYVSLSGWKEFRPIGEMARYSKKIRNIVVKLIRVLNRPKKWKM